MIKKAFYSIIIGIMLAVAFSPAQAADYGRRLTRQERNSICEEMKKIRQENAQSATNENTSLGAGIIPDSVLSSIYNTTQNISDSVSLVMVLGHALTCNAVHANKNNVDMFGITLFTYPNIPVWLCGAVIYFVGFMLTLSVTFYLVDIAFKLGFAVIMLPIGIALWPFPPTKSKLTALISIILKNAGIFMFLGMTVAYAVNLIGQAGGGLEEIFARIDNNETDTVAESFSIDSTHFLVVLFALIYGMKLIGSTIADYVDKFFPDKVFGGSSPIHGSMTQSMDFAKQKVGAPVASWAGDVAKTQTGRLTAGAGKLLTGQYNQQFRKAAHYATHPGQALDKGTQALGRFTGKVAGTTAKIANTAVMGTAGRILLGKNASRELRNRLDRQIDEKIVDNINRRAQKVGHVFNESGAEYDDEKAKEKLQNTVFYKASRQVKNTYDKTLNALNSANKRIDGLRDKWHNRIDRSVDNISRSIDKMVSDNPDDSRLAKMAKSTVKSVLKAPVKAAGRISKIPTGLAAGIAKVPTGAAKVAVKAANIKSWSQAAGNIMINVGEKMQDNKKTPAQLEAEKREREERIRRLREEESKNDYSL